VILKLLQIKNPPELYNSLLKQIFGDSVPSSFSKVPTFSDKENPESFLNDVYLMPEGICAWKRVLWVLSEFHPFVKHCPQVLSVSSLLLVYLNEAETYSVMTKLLSFSEEHQNYKRLHFNFSEEENLAMANSLSDLLLRDITSLKNLVQGMELNLTDCIKDMFDNFLIGYIKLPGLLRILLCFLSEGQKALIRIIHSIFQMVQHELPYEIVTDLKAKLKQFCGQIEDVNQLVSNGFRTKVQVSINNDLTGTGAKELGLDKLWGRLQPRYQIMVPKLVYTSQEHGMTLSVLLTKAARFPPNTPMVLKIYSESNEVMGVFLDCALHVNKGYFGGVDCFMFELEPELKIYEPKGLNEMFAYVSKELLIFGGGGEGPALTIDSDLLNCTSSCSETFGNPVICRGSFKCLNCQVIALA